MRLFLQKQKGNTRQGEKLDEETFGMLYFAEIKEFEKELHSEIEKIIFTDSLVGNWTYPLIQPKLFEEAKRRMGTIHFTRLRSQ